MSAAVVIHYSGAYPYPQAVLASVGGPPQAPSQPPTFGRPCRHATHMRAADGQSAVFALDGSRRQRNPLGRFPSVQLRLLGARALHVTTADALRPPPPSQPPSQHLSRYFSEASARYRPFLAAGRWAEKPPRPPQQQPLTESATPAHGDFSQAHRLPWEERGGDFRRRRLLHGPDAADFPDDPSAPRERPFTVGGGTANRKNRSHFGLPPAAPAADADDADTVAVAAATESRAQYRGRREDGWSEQREEVRRHRDRMRESRQVRDLLAAADEDAHAGDARSRFWSESARAAAAAAPAGGGRGSRGPVRRCSTAPPTPHQLVTEYRRVSGNRVLSRIRDQYADMPVIF